MNRNRHFVSLAVVVSVVATMIAFAPPAAIAAPSGLILRTLPQGSFTVAAAAPRSDVLTDTGNNATGVHRANGTDWYLTSKTQIGYWGFTRAGDGVYRPEVASGFGCDQGGVTGLWINPGASLRNAGARMCWTMTGATIDKGWRIGAYFGLDGWSGQSDSSYRAVYEAENPSYYPLGPQANVDQKTLAEGGWSLCFSGSMMDVVSFAAVADACQGKFMMLAGMAGPNDFVAPATSAKSTLPVVAGPGQTLAKLSDPRGVVVTPDGRVFVGELSEGRVYEYVPGQGLVVRAEDIPQVHGLAYSPTGEILATEFRAGHLWAVNPNGGKRLVGSIPEYSPSVATGSDGSIYIGSILGLRKYTPDFSSYTTLFGSSVGYVANIVGGAIGFNTWTSPSTTNILYADGSLVSFANGAQPYPEGLTSDEFGNLYVVANSSVVLGRQGHPVAPLIRLPFGAYGIALDSRGWLYAVDGGSLTRYPIAVAPDAPAGVSTSTSDGAVTVTWQTQAGSKLAEAQLFTASATPGGKSCTTSLPPCTITGLTNRQLYTFTVTATNTAGTSDPSTASAAVMPLAPGFQAWSDDTVLAVGSSTSLRFAQSAAGTSISVTGSMKASVTADSTGFGSTTFAAAKAGIQKFTAAYSVKVGKKTIKYTTTTQLYVPSVMGPMLKIKQSKTGKFSLQFMPPGAAVSIALSDGRTLTGSADSAGKASFTPTFNTLGAVTYTASVASVQVGTGGLTVTK